MMSGSATRTSTIADTRKVTAKLAADLDILRTLHARSKLSEAQIALYEAEALTLLNQGYLDWVKYGLQKDGDWQFAIKYTARMDGTLTTDDDPGRLRYAGDLTGASFYTMLQYSSRFFAQTPAEQKWVKDSIAIKRTTGTEPSSSGGYWEQTKTYSSNGAGVIREVYRKL